MDNLYRLSGHSIPLWKIQVGMLCPTWMSMPLYIEGKKWIKKQQNMRRISFLNHLLSQLRRRSIKHSPRDTLFNSNMSRSMELVFTPKFEKKNAGTRSFQDCINQGINCVRIGISWFRCNTRNGFLGWRQQIMTMSYSWHREIHIGLYKKGKIRVQVILS